MKTSHVLPALAVALSTSLSAAEITQEFEASYNASAGARTNLNGVRNGDVSEQNASVKYVFSYIVPERPIVRLGFNYDRFDFGFTGPARIPSTLQSLNFITGIDLKLWDVLIRVEAQPGFYGDSQVFNASDFNIPLVLGCAYVVNKNFQWIAGVSYNPNRNNPVWGGIGFRWRIDDRWTLNVAPPNPRLEFKATDDLTLFAGGQILNSSFRVNENLGGGRGRAFNGAIVVMTEIRTGAGATWKFAPKGSFEVELGYVAYREFDYYKVNDNFETKSGSIYGQAGIKLSF